MLRYASIPIVAALIGYCTNVLAIQMTFLPLEYFGFGEAFFHKWGFSLGWQVHGTHAGRTLCTGPTLDAHCMHGCMHTARTAAQGLLLPLPAGRASSPPRRRRWRARRA